MGHSHSHSHSHSHAHPDPSYDKDQRAFLIATGLNLSFVIIEIIYALISHSMSLLADAGHNAGDVLGLLFAWGASYLLTRPATDQYSYGYKKTTILAALANSFLLILATGMIIYESILRLLHPIPVTEHIIMIIAGIGILINGGTALLFIKNSQDDLNIKSAFIHLASDAILSLGVVITGGLVLWTHLLWLDPAVGLLIGLTILFGTWGLIKESINRLLDAVPSKIDQKKVKHYLLTLPQVTAVHDLHIWSLSTKETALTAHLIIPNINYGLTDLDYQNINQHLNHYFNIHHVTIQVERGHLENPCGQASIC